MFKDEATGSDGYIPTPATLNIPEVFQGRILPCYPIKQLPSQRKALLWGKDCRIKNYQQRTPKFVLLSCTSKGLHR